MSRRITGTNPAVASNRGRDVLFKTSADFPDVVEIDVSTIDPNPFQPRKTFDEDALDALAASIEDNGLQQPVGVIAAPGGRYTLIWGERRLRAVKKTGRDTIFAVLAKVSPEDAGEIALIENTQRSDLTPFELADALDGLRKQHGHSHDAMARLIGKHKSYVTKTLTLLRLPEGARDDFAAAQVKPTWTEMVKIGQIEDEAERERAWTQCLARLTDADNSDVANDDALDRDDKGEGKTRRAPEETLSALSLRNARHLMRSREVLRSLVLQPKPLMDTDRHILEQMREDIDRILNSEPASG